LVGVTDYLKGMGREETPGKTTSHATPQRQRWKNTKEKHAGKN